MENDDIIKWPKEIVWQDGVKPSKEKIKGRIILLIPNDDGTWNANLVFTGKKGEHIEGINDE